MPNRGNPEQALITFQQEQTFGQKYRSPRRNILLIGKIVGALDERKVKKTEDRMLSYLEKVHANYEADTTPLPGMTESKLQV